MNTKKTKERITARIETLSITYNCIRVTLSGINYIHFINPREVNFFVNDEKNNAIELDLAVGRVIEFDCTTTRQLYNVEIQSDETDY